MQRTRVRSLVRELTFPHARRATEPAHHNCWAQAPQLESPGGANYRAHALWNPCHCYRAHAAWSLRATAREEKTCTLQLERSRAPQRRACMPQGRSRVPRLRPDAAKNKIKINNKSFLKKEIVIVLCIWGVSSYIIRLIYHEILNCCNEIGALTVLSHCPVGLLQTTAMPQNRLLLDAQTFTQTHEHTQPATPFPVLPGSPSK